MIVNITDYVRTNNLPDNAYDALLDYKFAVQRYVRLIDDMEAQTTRALRQLQAGYSPDATGFDTSFQMNAAIAVNDMNNHARRAIKFGAEQSFITELAKAISE